MSIFAIIPLGLSNAAKLDAAIEEAFDGEHRLRLEGGAWLVADSGTAEGISGQLGITTGAAGSAIVVEMASYFGRANPAVWSWVKNNWEANALG